MSWLLLSFTGPVLWAISTHFDKYLVERYFKISNVGTLLIFTACTSAAILPPIWFLNPEVAGIDMRSALLMTAAGALYMGAMLFYLKALQREDASLVAVFFQAGPLLGYVLAYVVLGERLSPTQMAGGLLTICGVVISSIQPHPIGRKFKPRFALLMLTCSLALAVSALMFKFVAIRDAFWPSVFWMYVGEALFGLLLLGFGPDRRQFLQLIKSNPAFVISINAVNELINLVGTIATRFALTLAPLSLVQAIGGTTTLFVFAFGIVLSLFYPNIEREDLGPRALAQKGLAALFVAAGVGLIGS